jgi:nucleoside-diphosphate-sugar epimerase
MRIVFVTGASGFIGSRLVPMLKELDFDVVTTPVDDVEVCFHLAGYHANPHRSKDVAPMVEANVAYGAAVAESLPPGCTFVNAGSFFQHVGSQDYAPACLYAATKQAFGDILRFYSDSKRLRVVELHFCDVYGPHDTRRAPDTHAPKLLPLLLEAARSSVAVELSEGHQLVNFLHVDDICRALVTGARRDGTYHQTFQVGGKFMRVTDFVALVSAAISMPVPVIFGRREYRPVEMFEPWQFAPRLPDWEPLIPLEEGIRKVWESNA